MTRQGKFKARVRARMERTGESYTDARRHLAGGEGLRTPPRVEPFVRLGGGEPNLVAWSTHHAIDLLDRLAALVAGMRAFELDHSSFLNPIGGTALHNATKLATFGTGVEWSTDDRDLVMNGEWASLRSKYNRDFPGVPPADSFSEARVRALRERLGNDLRAAGFQFNMSEWHAEKTAGVFEELSELTRKLSAVDSDARATLMPMIISARNAARQLWSLTSSREPPESRAIGAAAPNAAREHRDNSLQQRKLAPNVRSGTYYIAKTKRPCSKCHKDTETYAFILPPGHEFLFDNEHWEESDDAASVMGVGVVCGPAAEAVRAMTSTYRPSSVNGGRWTNHCRHCDAELSDFDDHEEPEGAFFPMTQEAAASIVLHQRRGPFEAFADYGTLHLFEAMTIRRDD